MTVPWKQSTLYKGLGDVDMICVRVKSSGKTENGTKTACCRNWTKSIILITNTVGAFPFHVLTLYNKPNFTIVKFPPFSLNFVVETSVEDFILRGE